MVKLASKKSSDCQPRRHRADVHAQDAARALWTDRWVSYPRAEAILSRLDDLLFLPPRVRMQNVLIHGVSGAGKSMIIESSSAITRLNMRGRLASGHRRNANATNANHA